MNKYFFKALLFAAFIWSGAPVFSQTISNQPRGFIDLNKDGINDWFVDANGDGINDVDQQPYKHNFQFQDANGDGINDLFMDADGDGVNDLNTGFVDKDGDGWNDNIIDANRDWINDITGLRYNRRYLGGERYGYIWEERGGARRGSRPDPETNQPAVRNQNRQQRQGIDRFIDTDGDGINDNRNFDRHRQQGNPRGRKRG